MLSESMDAAPDRCPVCLAVADDGAAWILLSRHRTTQGEIEYCLSMCGCVVVLLNGELLKATPGHVRGGVPRPRPGHVAASGHHRLPAQASGAKSRRPKAD